MRAWAHPQSHVRAHTCIVYTRVRDTSFAESHLSNKPVRLLVNENEREERRRRQRRRARATSRARPCPPSGSPNGPSTNTFQTDHLLLLPNGPECIIDFKTAAEIVPDVAPIPNDMVTLVMMIDDDDGGG